MDANTISHLIKTFHLALTYLRIYPPTSQLVVVTVDTFYKIIKSLVEKNKTLTFSELSDKLLIDGKEAELREIQLIANNILKLFHQRKIQSITFKQDITKEELSSFLTNLLQKKREELGDYPNIALDQTVYVAMVKGEDVIVKVSELVNNSGGDIPGLLKSLRESYDMIDQLPDQIARNQAQDHLAQELSKQNTNVLREIFDRELPLRMEDSGLKKRLLGALSQDKIQEIFGEITGWYEEIRKIESSDFGAVDQLEKLKIFMQTILQAPAAKEVPKQFFEELLRKGLLTQLPEWFQPPPSQPATVYEVERLLEKSPIELIRPEILDQLPQMVEKLCQIEYEELIGKLVEKLLENIHNSAAKIRLPTIKKLASIYEILNAHNKENLLKYMETPLLEATKKENSCEVHYYLIEILRLRARQNILFGNYELALRIIDLFRQHISDEVIRDEKIRQNAQNSLNNLIPEIIDVLISDLKLDSEKKRLGSLQILSKLGEKAIEPLIRVIKEGEDIRNRRLASLALKNLGDFAKKRFSEELNLGLTTQEIKNVVEVLADLANEETLEQINTILQYPDISVKKEIMRFLAKMNSSQSKAMIIEQLKDTDYAVVTEAVRLIGESKCREAVPTLIKLLNSSLPLNIQEDICVALGLIGDYKAIPILISKLKKRCIFIFFRNNKIERIRMRSAWALRKFSGKDVEKSLEKACNDKSTSVSLTAKESLAIIRQNKT